MSVEVHVCVGCKKEFYSRVPWKICAGCGVRTQKITYAILPSEHVVWDHSLEAAIDRIGVQHAPNFDARDIHAFRFICNQAREAVTPKHVCPWHGRLLDNPSCPCSSLFNQVETCRQCRGLHREVDCDFIPRSLADAHKQIKRLEEQIKDLKEKGDAN